MAILLAHLSCRKLSCNGQVTAFRGTLVPRAPAADSPGRCAAERRWPVSDRHSQPSADGYLGTTPYCELAKPTHTEQ